MKKEVVGVIKGCPRPHNLLAHPDGLYYYTNEQEATIDVFDTRTLQLVEQLALTARPNKSTINKKHSKIYVGIVVAPCVSVSLTSTRTKRLRARGHDRYSQRLLQPGRGLGRGGP